jgi:hypothetical protein
MFDVQEITNFIMLSQVLARSSHAERLGLPPLNRKADFKAIVQTESSLNRIHTSGASLLSSGADQWSRRQLFLFRIRYVDLYTGGF